jgi:hypothetical protein
MSFLEYFWEWLPWMLVIGVLELWPEAPPREAADTEARK